MGVLRWDTKPGRRGDLRGAVGGTNFHSSELGDSGAL